MNQHTMAQENIDDATRALVYLQEADLRHIPGIAVVYHALQSIVLRTAMWLNDERAHR